MKIEIRSGMERMDFERVTQMLASSAWSPGISMEEVMQGARHSSLVVGAFCGGVQVGFARVVSDNTRIAYISDVYVDEAYRHGGVAKEMMLHILSHESLKDVYHWLLKSVADDLYKKLGFACVSEPEKWLEIKHDRPER